ncbi:hypothetical protein AAFF_G00414130 [Aldrovandia affinis]|uniref:Uncharacterized protein n=1 Tax=Aldrovandia affinis TaxID=143900 RepID=A0AAD7VYZ1_9TELE|nr:hypothetical protein AAFF_G00414130 [Aldrovandia affinis]
MNTQKAEYALAAGRKEIANLRQKKACQIDYERRVKELKIKEVLRSHSWKVTSIEEQHLKAEFSYKAERGNLEESCLA